MIKYTLPNLPASLHALLDDRASTIGTKSFVITPDARHSYAEIAEHSRRIADRLQALVKPADRVALVMTPSPLYLSIWFALSRLGAIDVTVNPAYKGALLRQLVETARPSLCIIESEMRDPFLTSCEGLVAENQVIGPSELTDNLSIGPWEEGLGRSVGPRDISTILFTSGTTGRSKGVMMSQNQQMGFGAAYAEICEMNETDTVYNFLPFFHIAGRFTTLGAMMAGGSMILKPGFSLSAFWSDIRAYGGTVVTAVGGLCHMLQSRPDAPDDADNPLRLVYAVPAPWEFKEKFENRFGLKVVEGYGGTETNLVAYSRLTDETPFGAIGRPSPYFDVQIQDADGFEAPAGTAGEICVRPRHPATILSGYYEMPDKTVEALQDLWFHTGDGGYFDKDGYLYFSDRLNDSLRRRGENISSFEVERLLCDHPDIAETAVIPIPSELDEDEVKAIVVLKPGRRSSEEDIFLFATQKLPYFMVPRFIEFTKNLPRTPTMKVMKHELRKSGNGRSTWDCQDHGYKISARGFGGKTMTNR